jgi:molybdate transport system substrate-binding protein
MRNRAFASVAVVALLLAGACESSDTPEPASSGSGGSGEITVLAAASLTESFTQIAQGFQTANPGTEVNLSFGGSDTLAAQIDQGSPTDVFASASPTWMDDVEQNGPGVTNRQDFAKNRLVVIVPADNPAGIQSIDDLANDGVELVVAAEDVPVGTYARQALDNAGIAEDAEANVVSNEDDVKAVVQKVALGEADAGIVYQTDVTAAVKDKVTAIPIADDVNVIATYPIAVVDGAPNADLAASFETYVLGPGQDVLQSFGFLPAT